MFKVIESDEELESALAAGLLWVNTDGHFPRRESRWDSVVPEDVGWARAIWRDRHTGDPGNYMPEDFAVLVEDEDSE